MKKLILILTLTSLLFSCSNGGNASSSNTPTTGNNVDYEFTITINGQVNKVKGNTANGIPMGQAGPYFNGYSYINNSCNWTTSNPYVVLKINDVTASNYVSGQTIYCQILLQNALLGTCQGLVGLSGGPLNSLSNSASFSFQNYLPINITDLGTTPTINALNGAISSFGNSIKGNYSGTIDLTVMTNSGTVIHYPAQISIDFKAVRLG